MKKRIVIDIKFNNRGIPVEKTEKWINARIAIFQKYTLKSLKKQINQDFLCVLRYDETTWNEIKDALRKYPKLPKNVKFTPHKKTDDLIKDYIDNSGVFYLVRLDSDDMYHKTFIQQLDNFKPKRDTKIILNQKGYIYDSKRNLLKETYRQSPPFYTFIYMTSDFLSGQRTILPGGHKAAIKLPHEVLSKRNFIITIHHDNKSSKFNNKNNHKIKNSNVLIEDPLRSRILAEFM